MSAARKDNWCSAFGALLAACFALSPGYALTQKKAVNFMLWQMLVTCSLIAILFPVHPVRLESCAITPKIARPSWRLLRGLVLVAI